MSVELYRPTHSLSFLYTQGGTKIHPASYTPHALENLCFNVWEVESNGGAGTTNVENYKRGGEFI